MFFQNPSVRRVCDENFARILTRGLSFLTMVSSIRSCLDYKVFKKIFRSELWFSIITENICYIWLIAGIEVNFLVLGNQYVTYNTQSFSI